jgi:dihydrofolate reductase
VGFAGKMNSMPKYVVSSTLKEGTWNNTTVISGDVANEVRKLKETVDGDILINGSGRLTRALLEDDLIDEYRLMVYPVVLGSGNRLFADAGPMSALQLTDSVRTGECLILTYNRRSAEEASASEGV